MLAESYTNGLNNLLNEVWSNEFLFNRDNSTLADTVWTRDPLTLGRIVSVEFLCKEVEELKKRVAELEAAQAPGQRFLQKQKPA